MIRYGRFLSFLSIPFAFWLCRYLTELAQHKPVANR